MMDMREQFRWLMHHRLRGIAVTTMNGLPAQLKNVPEWQQRQVREVILEDMVNRMVDTIMEEIDDVRT